MRRIAWLAWWGVAALAASEPLPPGGELQFDVAVSDELRRVIGGGRRAAVGTARVFVALPEGFDPARVWPIVVISATGDEGHASSVAWAKRYAPAAQAAGWVVVGADATVRVRPETNELRYGLARAALAGLAERWPAAADAPLALGGFSGGSKYSGYLAAQFARDGRVPAGIFLGGCNEAAPAIALHRFEPPRKTFRAVPVYLSSGDSDRVAAPGDHARVARELRAAGFTHVRLETYAGGHVTHPPHLTDALRWFADLRRGP